MTTIAPPPPTSSNTSTSSSSSSSTSSLAAVDNPHGLQLSAEQHRVVYNPKFGNTRVIACAGAGKTTTMILRMLHMMTQMDCRPEEFFVVTFTKNAALNIVEKLIKAL